MAGLPMDPRIYSLLLHMLSKLNALLVEHSDVIEKWVHSIKLALRCVDPVEARQFLVITLAGLLSRFAYLIDLFLLEKPQSPHGDWPSGIGSPIPPCRKTTPLSWCTSVRRAVSYRSNV